MHDFEYNGKKLSDIGAVITEKPHYTVSMRDLSLVTIPGRSGDVINDAKRYKNVEISYQIASVPAFCHLTEQEFIYTLSEWLFSSHSYKILRDTYNVGYFRLAVATAVSNPVVEASGVVTTTITFSCDPFLYSDLGTLTVKKTTDTGDIRFSMRNPERWSSLPKIKIIGNGDFMIYVPTQSEIIANVTNELTIDKSIEDVYDKDGVSRNDKICGLNLPEFPPGESIVVVRCTTAESSFSVEITPNWRRL